MFGLTRREQRWKAEQKAAELLVNFATNVVQARAQADIAKATIDRQELERLRSEVNRLTAIVDARSLDHNTTPKDQTP